MKMPLSYRKIAAKEFLVFALSVIIIGLLQAYSKYEVHVISEEMDSYADSIRIEDSIEYDYEKRVERFKKEIRYIKEELENCKSNHESYQRFLKEKHIYMDLPFYSGMRYADGRVEDCDTMKYMSDLSNSIQLMNEVNGLKKEARNRAATYLKKHHKLSLDRKYYYDWTIRSLALIVFSVTFVLRYFILAILWSVRVMRSD